jgi:outer membrane cobalamin receptor
LPLTIDVGKAAGKRENKSENLPESFNCNIPGMDIENVFFMQRKRFVSLNMCFATMCIVPFAVISAQHHPPTDTVKWYRLSDVEVVASPRRSVTKQAAPLQVLDKESMIRLGMQELSEAVRRFSGVTVKDYGGIGGLKTVSIRSLGAHHTAVNYDGVSVADAQSGQVDISRFTLDNVAMISLSTGQGDDIFQTARTYASAGVLNIQTQQPHFKENRSYQWSAKLKSGSFGFFNPMVSYSQKLHTRWSASAYADYMRADSRYPFTLVNGAIKTREERINSDIETFRLEGNVYGLLGAKGGRLDTKLYAFHSERGLPGSVNFYSKTTTERLWNENRFIQTQYGNQIHERLAVRLVAKYAFAHSRYKDVNDKYAAGYQEDRNTQREFYASAGVFYTPLSDLSASLTTDYANTRLRNNFIHAVQPVRHTSLTALAAQYKARQLTVTGSLLATGITDEVAYGDRPPDRKYLSPAMAASWRPFENNTFRLRVSYKDIFRVPTFADLYYLRVGNSDLTPEKARQFNAGLTWSGRVGSFVRYLSLSADGYYNKVKDKIVALPTLYIWRMMNMGEVKIKGADVNLSAEVPLPEKTNLLLSGSYTYQHAIDVTNPEAKNYKDQIPYTPRHTGNASATFETPWINISYLLTVVGERYALPQNTKANRVDAYAEQSLSLNRTFDLKNTSLRLQGEILNLANTQYDVIQYYPMPGRSWRLSVSMNL